MSFVIENHEREGYAMLPESFHKFVEMFVLLEKKIIEITSLFDVMYNPKKGRNKDLDQLQKEINEMKEKLNVLGMDIESLGQQFKQNLIFLFNVIKSKETMAKEWQNSSQEILSLKLQVKHKHEEISRMSGELQDRAMSLFILSDQMNQLQNYVKILENKCESKNMELEIKSTQCNQSDGSLHKLKKKTQSTIVKLTNERESLKCDNALLKKQISELETLVEKYKVKAKSTNRDNESLDLAEVSFDKIGILDESLLKLVDENDALRFENEKKCSTIERLREEIESLKREPQLQIGILTRENVMLQKLLSDQDLKIQRVATEEKNKISFKERAIQDGLLDLHSKLSFARKESILMKEDFEQKELESKKKILELEEKLKAKERGMEMYEGYVKQARNVINQLRKITH